MGLKMRAADLKDLTNTVENLRKDPHPDLDAAFVEAVVQAEEQNPEDDTEALRAIQVALKTALTAQGVL